MTKKEIRDAIRSYVKERENHISHCKILKIYPQFPLVIIKADFQKNTQGLTFVTEHKKHLLYVILIKNGMHRYEEVQTFFHELCHFVSFLHGGSFFSQNINLEESFCYALDRVIKDIVKNFSFK